MNYDVYAVDGAYISGKHHTDTANVMKTLSKCLIMLNARQVQEVVVVGSGTVDEVLFRRNNVSSSQGIIVHKVYDDVHTGGHEAIYLLGKFKESITDTLLGKWLDNEYTLKCISVYDLATGEFVLERHR